MASTAPIKDHGEVPEGYHSQVAPARVSKCENKRSKSGSRGAADKIKAKALSIKRPSKAQERAEKRLQKALEKQVAKGAREVEKREHLSLIGDREIIANPLPDQAVASAELDLNQMSEAGPSTGFRPTVPFTTTSR